MSIDQFIDKLEADGGWELNRFGWIRRTVGGCCPVEHINGGPCGSWLSAMSDLNVVTDDRRAILRAADHDDSCCTDREHVTRARLLKACGLEEA